MGFNSIDKNDKINEAYGKILEGSGKYPELDKIAKKVAADTGKMINKLTQKVKSEMPYKAQYVLEETIKILKEAV